MPETGIAFKHELMWQDFWNYLPSPFHDPNNIMAGLLCYCTGYFYRLMPPLFKTQLLRQWAVVFVGIEWEVLTVASPTWAIGSGFIVANFTMVTYDLFFAQLEIQIRKVMAKFFPMTDLPLQEPLEPGPGFPAQPPPPPPPTK